MKTIAATLLALGLLSGTASASQSVFSGIADSAPRSAFDQLADSAPRSLFDQISDSAPRSVFDDLRDTAPRSHGKGFFTRLQHTAP